MDDTTIHAYGKRVIASACLLGAAAWSGAAPADASPEKISERPVRNTAAERPVTAVPRASVGDSVQNAFDHVNEAIAVLRTMEADPDLRNALERATGVLVVPDYARAALGVGARGGAGVLFVKRGGTWVSPTFYTLGGVSVGLQAGAEAGSIAMILNNQKALDSFKQNDNFSLNADAGLTVLAWSGKGQASVGKGDVTMWSDTAGLFGDVAISVTDVNFDEEETAAYYGQRIAGPQMVINGQIKNPHDAVLKRAIATLPSAGGSTGSSGGTGSSGSKGDKGSGSGGY